MTERGWERRIDDLVRWLSALSFAAFGLLAYLLALAFVTGRHDGTSFERLLACKLFSLAILGSIGSLALTAAAHLATGGNRPRSVELPRVLQRLCPGCGRLADDEEPHALSCPRCHLSSGVAPWRADRQPSLALLFGALSLGSIGSASLFVGVLAARDAAAGSGSLLSALIVSAGALGLAVVGPMRLVTAYFDAKKQHPGYESRLRRSAGRGRVDALVARAWLDAKGRLRGAEGGSSFQGTSEPCSIAWSRLPAHAADGAATYRTDAGEPAWICEELCHGRKERVASMASSISSEDEDAPPTSEESPLLQTLHPRLRKPSHALFLAPLLPRSLPRNLRPFSPRLR